MSSGQPELVFIALYRHHVRYFNLLTGNDLSFQGLIVHVSRFLRPIWKRERLTEEEFATITRYSTRRKKLAWPLLKYSLCYKTFRLFQRIAATLYFSNSYTYFKAHRPQVVAVWNGMNLPLAAIAAAAGRLGIDVFYFENGPLPNTTMIDRGGINYENRFPRDPEFFRLQQVNRDQLDRLLRTGLVPRKPRAGKKSDSPARSILPERFYFLPFQTYSDTQILLFSPWIKDMEELTRQVDSAILRLPQPMTLVVKEHPSCRKDYTYLREAFGDRVLFADGISTQELIEKSSGVITINSTVGIESILLDRPVLTVGQAFYNIPGLVLHAVDPDSLAHSLGELSEFRPDPAVREGFLYYLSRLYLVRGSIQQDLAGYRRNVDRRIKALLTP